MNTIALILIVFLVAICAAIFFILGGIPLVDAFKSLIAEPKYNPFTEDGED